MTNTNFIIKAKKLTESGWQMDGYSCESWVCECDDKGNISVSASGLSGHSGSMNFSILLKESSYSEIIIENMQGNTVQRWVKY